MRLDPAVRRALDETGLPYSVEQGGRHRKVRLAGTLTVVLSNGARSDTGRERRNTIATIRRQAAKLKGAR